MINREHIMALADQDTDDCILWDRGTDGAGYPKVFDGQRNVGGHRYVVEQMLEVCLAHGDEVMHSCDMPLCVNPRHLLVGNHRLNMQDMNKKGRAVNLNGSSHGRSKFDETQVRAIMDLYVNQGWSVRQIADTIDAPYSRVWMVCKRKNWRHMW